MNSLFKLLFGIIIFIFTSEIVVAQNTTIKNSIVIKNNKISDKENYYKTIIYKANMEPYRLKEKDVTITFAEGFECVLLSAKTLLSNGIAVDLDLYQQDFSEKFVLPTFSITEKNELIALYTKVFK